MSLPRVRPTTKHVTDVRSCAVNDAVDVIADAVLRGFFGTNYKRPSMFLPLCATGFGKCVPGIAGPQSCSHSLKVIEGRL